MGYKRHTAHCNFAKKTVDMNKLYDCFIENFNWLFDRLKCKLGEGSLLKNLLVFYRKRLLKSAPQFCISNVLSHLLFFERSPNTPGSCEQCSRPLYVSNIVILYPM